MFQKKMIKTLHQNRFLQDSKPFSQFLILTQNSYKEPKTTFLISLLVNSCRTQTKMSGKKPAQQPQPPKLPKQLPPNNTSQAKNPNQLVPVSPVSLASRYVVSTILKPNYERPHLTQPSFRSALVSPAPRAIPKSNYERPPLTQPSFSSTLVSTTPRAITPYTDDPFGPSQSQKSSQHPNRKNRSPYVKKPYIQHIF